MRKKNEKKNEKKKVKNKGKKESVIKFCICSFV